MPTFYSLCPCILKFPLRIIVELQEEPQIEDLVYLYSADFGDDIDLFVGENVHDMFVELLFFLMLDDKLLSRAQRFPPILARAAREVVTEGTFFAGRLNERLCLR